MSGDILRDSNEDPLDDEVLYPDDDDDRCGHGRSFDEECEDCEDELRWEKEAAARPTPEDKP